MVKCFSKSTKLFGFLLHLFLKAILMVYSWWCLLLKVETGWIYCALLRFLADPFDRSSPSPGYFNPIPWKPIHIPPPEKPEEETCSRKPQRQHRSKQSPSAAFRLRTPARPGQFQRRWRSRLTPVNSDSLNRSHIFLKGRKISGSGSRLENFDMIF